MRVLRGRTLGKQRDFGGRGLADANIGELGGIGAALLLSSTAQLGSHENERQQKQDVRTNMASVMQASEWQEAAATV